MDEQTKQRIDDNVKNSKVYLFMKGTPESPQCGFSAQVTAVLQTYKIPFQAFDVLSDDAIREGIKEYSDWPTIPQLYVNGNFIGGCDVVTEMHNNGELAQVLGSN